MQLAKKTFQVPCVENALQNIGRLLNRGYWSRVWVIQDFALARDLYIMCGSEVIPFVHLDYFIERGWMADLLCKNVTRQHSHALNHREGELFSKCSRNRSFHALIEFRWLTCAGRQSKANLLSVSDILFQICRSFAGSPKHQATDPRDIILGTLALCHDAFQLGIDADYSISCPKLFLQTSKALILKQKKSQLLFLTSWTIKFVCILNKYGLRS